MKTYGLYLISKMAAVKAMDSSPTESSTSSLRDDIVVRSRYGILLGACIVIITYIEPAILTVG